MSPQSKIFFTCSYLVCISIVFTQTYLISLPNIAHDLHLTQSFVQFTFTTAILGFGFSQIFYGPLSDMFGRKRILLCGLYLTLLGTSTGALSTNKLMLCSGQFLIGIGAGACAIIPRVIAKDVFNSDSLLKAITYMSIASTIATGISPIIGGFIQSVLKWRCVFIFLIFLTLATLFYTLICITETIKKSQASLSTRQIKKNYILIFSNSWFLTYAILNSLAYSALIIYLILSPFIFQTVFLYSPSQNGIIYFLCAFSYSVGNFISSYLNKLISAKNIIAFGIVTIVIGSISVIIPISYHSFFSAELIICGILIHLGSGLITPITYQKILDNSHYAAGFSAGAVNCMRVFIAFILNAVITALAATNSLSIAYLLGLISIACLSLFYKFVYRENTL